MSVLFFILLLLSIVVFMVGIIDPKLVIFWGPKEQRTSRCNVVLSYSIVIFVFLIMFGVSAVMTQPSPEQQAINAQIAEQKAAEKAQQEEAKAKEAEIKAKEREEEALMSDAFYTSQAFIEQRLKSPSTAKFASRDESKVLNMGENLYVIVSYVDSQNGFGAMIRTKYNIALKYTEDKKWKLERLTTN